MGEDRRVFDEDDHTLLQKKKLRAIYSWTAPIYTLYSLAVKYVFSASCILINQSSSQHTHKQLSCTSSNAPMTFYQVWPRSLSPFKSTPSLVKPLALSCSELYSLSEPVLSSLILCAREVDRGFRNQCNTSKKVLSIGSITKPSRPLVYHSICLEDAGLSRPTRSEPSVL